MSGTDSATETFSQRRQRAIEERNAAAGTSSGTQHRSGKDGNPEGQSFLGKWGGKLKRTVGKLSSLGLALTPLIALQDPELALKVGAASGVGLAGATFADAFTDLIGDEGDSVDLDKATKAVEAATAFQDARIAGGNIDTRSNFGDLIGGLPQGTTLGGFGSG